MPGLGQATELDNIWDVLDREVARGLLPGFVAIVGRRDRVWSHVGGVRNVETREPMTQDTVFAVASIGKPITAVSALMLVQDGVLGLDTPVDPWLPELADRRVLRQLDGDIEDTVPAERSITLRDLLTLRMGLGLVLADPDTTPIAARIDELGIGPSPVRFPEDSDAFMSRLGSLPLVHQPGERWLYHTGLDAAGILVGRASGMSLADFQRERIFVPLGMTDTGFYGPSDRLTTIHWRISEDSSRPEWGLAEPDAFAEPPVFEAGGEGHVSTASDFLAFGRFLLDGGTAGGRRLLAADLVAEMLTDQLTPEQKAASPWLDENFWLTHGWGLGVAVRTAPAKAKGRFGWWGGLGATFWCDPQTDTVALLFTQRVFTDAEDYRLAETFFESAFAARGEQLRASPSYS